MTQQSLSITTRPDGKLDIQGLAIWASGTYHGHGSPPEGDTFTTAELDEMVKAHNEVGTNLRPRMYAGHPLNPWLKMLARPQGEITRLYREGDVLKADLKGVDKTFWKKAQSDGARLSPDVKLNHHDHRKNKIYPMAVVGLGVLGAVQPANNGLPALDEYKVLHYADNAQARAYGEGDVRSYTSGLTVGNPAPVSEIQKLSQVRNRVMGATANTVSRHWEDSDTESVPTFSFPLV